MKPIRKPLERIDRENNLVWVQGRNGKFPCKIVAPIVRECAQLGDDVSIVKSAVTGEWLCIDYHIDTPTNWHIHNTYQTNYDDMIVDEKGVPY